VLLLSYLSDVKRIGTKARARADTSRHAPEEVDAYLAALAE
jgi:hypothetical protein